MANYYICMHCDRCPAHDITEAWRVEVEISNHHNHDELDARVKAMLAKHEPTKPITEHCCDCCCNLIATALRDGKTVEARKVLAEYEKCKERIESSRDEPGE